MNVGIHIETNILFSLFCVLLYYQQKQHKVFDFLGSTAFNSLLWSSLFIMVLDSISWFFMGDLIPHADWHLLLVQSVYYLAQAILPLNFLVYCINTTGTTISRLHKGLMYTPILFTLVVLLINHFTGCAFFIENNGVSQGKWYALAIIVPMIYITISLLLCLSFYLKNLGGSEEKRKIAFHMFICVLLSFLGALACAFVKYLSPWHVFIASLVYLYMQLHSYRERSLDVLAYTDSLTGLKNHAAYSHIKEKMDAKIKGSDCHFAVAVMDVNDLKQVNDAYGHKSGDSLIISSSRLLCQVFHHSPVCRIGGDEFVAILENSDYENRAALQTQFAEQMEKTVFFADNVKLPLTAALGIAEYRPEKHASFDEVFQEADTAMYENKTQFKSNPIK